MSIKNLKPLSLILLFGVATYLALFSGEGGNPFVALTAVAGLGISLFNFYYQYLWSIHDVSCTLVAVGYNGNKFTAHYTFENIGTYQEIIIGGTFVFPMNGDGRLHSAHRRNLNNRDRMPELMDPFVINPKEIVLKKFEWDFTYEDLLIHFNAMNGTDFQQIEPVRLLSFKVDFVNPKTRTKSSKVINCSDIKFYDDFVDTVKPYRNQNKLFEGHLSIF